MSRISDSVTGGGGGSGLDGSWGERSDRGLKYPGGDVVGKLGSNGVVNVDEDCDGAVRIELARGADLSIN